MENHLPPSFSQSVFDCPHCGVRCRHDAFSKTLENKNSSVHYTICQHCDKPCIWVNFPIDGESIYIYPGIGLVPKAHGDMPNEAKIVYEEAAQVLGKSNRAAAALIRLALQLILKELDCPSAEKNLKDAIKELVGKGASPDIESAAQSLRISGNHAIHPGKIDKDESEKEHVMQLFELLNIIVIDRISNPKKIKELRKIADKAEQERKENKN